MPADLVDIAPLLGYMDEQYAMRFLAGRCVLPAGTDAETLARKSRAAAASAGAPPVGPAVIDLPESPAVSAVLKDGRIGEVVKRRGWSLKQVEIDGLVSLQKYVNLTYAEEISKGASLESLEDRVRFCLTDGYATRDSEVVSSPASKTFAMKSSGTDLRVTDFDAAQEPKTGVQKVSFTVGWGHPFVVVARLRDRYILNNGYHRTYALRERGVERVPCLLVEVDSYAELESAGPPALFGPEVVLSARPPVFSDLFNRDISPVVKMRPSSTSIVIRPAVTTLDSAAMSRYFVNETRAAPRAPSESEYVDVRPVSEDWSAYLLEDGTRLEIRAVLTRARRRADGSLGEAVLSDPIWVTNPPKGRKGPRSQPPLSKERLDAAIVHRDMAFTVLREPTNEYSTERGERIFAALRLVRVSRTSLYDENGDAIYVFTTTRDVTLA